MARPERRHVCSTCGAESLRWEGQCRGCGEWNTLVEAPPERGRRGPPPTGVASHSPIPLPAVQAPGSERHRVGVDELDRVLGGGLVRGSVILLGGEPGIGKSTLVLELAARVAASTSGGVLYVSGEESPAQLGLRATRLGLADRPEAARLAVLAETRVEAAVGAATVAGPALLVVDSIQTLTSDAIEAPAGSVGQVRECAARLHAFAKEHGVPVVLVGHVTKDGTLAGPKTLEHLVDVVLTLEGERFGALRLLRAVKNRFGSTDEVGVFEMTAEGLRPVSDPGRAFLEASGREAPGVAVAATLEATRPLLVEVQALVAQAGYGTPRRTVSGVDPSRLALLLAVLARRARVPLGSHDVYASLAGGLDVAEPALDLPLALALVSSFRDSALPAGVVAAGEVGLTGDLRPVRGLERRLREAARLGFRRALVPEDATSLDVPGLAVVRVRTLRDALREMGLIGDVAARGLAEVGDGGVSETGGDRRPQTTAAVGSSAP